MAAEWNYPAHRTALLDAIERSRASLGKLRTTNGEVFAPPALTDADAPGSMRAHTDVGLHTWAVDWPAFWNGGGSAGEDFLVEPLLARRRGHAVVAPGKAGKSLLLQETAFALATGRKVLRRPASEPLDVVYLDMEMTEDDLEERAEDFGYGPDDDLSHLHYLMMPSLKPLDTPEGGAELLAYCTDVGAKFCVIDTIARVLEGPENDADTLRAFYKYTGGPLKAAGITWARLDNTGRDPTKGGRGTSAKVDDVDVVWLLQKAENGLKLTATHRRVLWVPENVALATVPDPPRHRITERAWPPGTTDAARKLDQAGVPLGASRPKARDLLTDAGLSVGTDALRAGLAWRKSKDGQANGQADGS